MESSFGRLKGALGLADAGNTFLGGLTQAFEDAQAAGIDMADIMAEKFDKVFKGTMGATFEKMTVQMIKDMEVQLAELNKVTGAAGRYNDMVVEAFYSTGQFGASMTELREGTAALNNQFTMYSTLAEGVQKSLIMGSAQLQRAGLSAQGYAESISFLTAAIGKTPRQAAAMTKELSAFAIKLGQAPEKMMKDFSKAGNVIAQFGDRGVEVFKELAQTAKALQVEMTAITGLTDRLDTFSGALETAGKLNATFGTNIDGVNLMLADQNQKVEMLVGALEKSGNRFGDLNRQQKMLMANNLGLSIGETAKLLQYDTVAALRAAKAATQEYMSDQEALKKANEANQSIQARWNALLERFSIAMRPVVEFMSEMIGKFIELNDKTGGAILKVLGIAASLKTLIFLGKGLKFIFGPLGAMFRMIAAGAASTAAATASTGAAAAGAAPGLLAVAGAVALFGVGIGVAAAGIGLLLSFFKDDPAERAAAAVSALKSTEGIAENLAKLDAPLGKVEKRIDGIVDSMAGLTLGSVALAGLAAVVGTTAPTPAPTGGTAVAGGGGGGLDTQVIGQQIGAEASKVIAAKLAGWKALLGTDTLVSFVEDHA